MGLYRIRFWTYVDVSLSWNHSVKLESKTVTLGKYTKFLNQTLQWAEYKGNWHQRRFLDPAGQSQSQKRPYYLNQACRYKVQPKLPQGFHHGVMRESAVFIYKHLLEFLKLQWNYKNVKRRPFKGRKKREQRSFHAGCVVGPVIAQLAQFFSQFLVLTNRITRPFLKFHLSAFLFQPQTSATQHDSIVLHCPPWLGKIRKCSKPSSLRLVSRET